MDKPTQELLVRVKDYYNHLMGARAEEIFDVWIKSLPDPAYVARRDLKLQIATSASAQKLTFRAAAPQAHMVEKIIDFIYVVGSSDMQIDRLNDIGTVIDPRIAGPWLEITEQGTNNGWCFPVQIPIAHALVASDPGHASRSLLEWVEKHNITHCSSLSGEMGRDSPSPIEILLKLPGDFVDQLYLVTDAFSFFGLPSVSAKAIDIIRLAEPENREDCLRLSVTISSTGCTRMGILIPSPGFSIVHDLCALIGGAQLEKVAGLEEIIAESGPAFVEYKYEEAVDGANKAGFDVILHYNAEVKSTADSK
eukprot:Phypoly_transcript_10295.p1 GENE.Phypoly_transcript_10295~~Phypoly_transcript_10295.p1  ORF type:complete len:308 (+),score=47.83 Phypoly_transcript_10295:130-1053(+)